MAASFAAAILVFLMPARALEVSAQSAVVLDGHTGQVLWEKNADQRSLIASTTKIMTALVVLERAKLDDLVTVPPEAQGVEGSSMYLRAGETLTVRDLLHGLMLASGNDAAVALAVQLSGSVEAFAEEMNRKAAALGIPDIHFANPHGLDSPENYATARSLGLLAAEAMKNPDFRAIVSTKTYTAGDRVLTNHNKLLWSYPGAVGVKTGYTKSAGRLLVGSAERDGRRLISVTVNAPGDWEDHRRMLDYGFSQYQMKTLVQQGQQIGTIPVLFGETDSRPLYAARTVEYPVLESETPHFRLLTRPYLTDIQAEETAGTLQIYLGDRLVEQIPVIAGAP